MDDLYYPVKLLEGEQSAHLAFYAERRPNLKAWRLSFDKLSQSIVRCGYSINILSFYKITFCSCFTAAVFLYLTLHVRRKTLLQVQERLFSENHVLSRRYLKCAVYIGDQAIRLK